MGKTLIRMFFGGLIALSVASLLIFVLLFILYEQSEHEWIIPLVIAITVFATGAAVTLNHKG